MAVPREGFLYRSSEATDTYVDRHQLEGSRPVTIDELAFSKAELDILGVHVAVVLASREGSVASELFYSVSVGDSF